MNNINIFIICLPRGRHRIVQLYNDYKRYCEINKYTTINKQSFEAQLRVNKKIKPISACQSCSGGIVEVI